MSGESTRPDDPIAVGRRAVALGLLSDDQARAALDRYRRQGVSAPSNFAAFLMDSGMVTREQGAHLSQIGGEPAASPSDLDRTFVGDVDEGDPDDPLVGAHFSGCAVQKKLGQGGMGSVYLARRDADGRQVVIKFLAPEQATNKTWRGRFGREARVMERIKHPNIVELYSVDADSERPHIVMEFVDGEPLDQGLARRGVFEPLEAARIARDAALGLAEAHKNGVIHRDIKPANLLLTWKGAVKVLDFGLAKSVSADDGLSMPGQVLGTPHYMAPEQWGDHQVDARCDVFSLGATLYHLVTGQLPFPGHNAQAISRLIAEGQFVRPRAIVPGLPEDLELVILRMMEVERRFRYGSAALCAEELEKVLEGIAVEVPGLVEPGGARHPIIGRIVTIGRDPTSTILINDPSVSRQHAQIERGKTGFILRDLGSTYGSFVAEMRVKDVVIKDGDPLRLGKVSLVFRDGGLGAVFSTTTKRIKADRLRAGTVAEPVLRALVEEGDKRTVLILLEQLAQDDVTLRVSQARRVLRHALDGDTAEAVAAKMEARLRRARATVPMRLFSLTHENLGDDAEAWLAWWDNAQDRYPGQLAPRQPRPTARFVVRAPSGERTVELEDKAVLTVGRDEKSQVLLDDRSVSRLHATLIRFHQRVVVRDEGSRFGTLRNGNRLRLAFLCPDDVLVMGKVELRFEFDLPDPSATVGDDEDVHVVEEDAFLVLEELAHPCIALALVRFLEEEAATHAWVQVEARRLFEADADRAAKLTARVMRAHARHAQRARDALPALLGGQAADPAGWRALLEQRDEDLPPQVLPRGWFAGPAP
ncbi:MAG: protein kinase [Planctomycetes bacterium]|nr:protein kinase [Planctomycetota bacterium]